MTLGRYLAWWLDVELADAVRYELLPANPAALVDTPTVQRIRREEITVDAARRLLRASRDDELKAAYLLALHIPLRVGEVVGVEWDCFDFDAGLFAVRQNLVRVERRWELHATKTRKARIVPLPSPVADSLRRHRARQAEQRLAAGAAWQPPQVLDVTRGQWRAPAFVFTRATGKPHLQQGFYKQLRGMCRAAGIPPLATHDLRRAANTLLLTSGVDPVVVRHLSPDMTDLYTTRLDSRMEEAVERLAGRLQSATAG